jgi:hypothetical protein
VKFGWFQRFSTFLPPGYVWDKPIKLPARVISFHFPFILVDEFCFFLIFTKKSQKLIKYIKMETLLGLKGQDFVMVAADRSHAHSIMVLKDGKY